MTISITKARDYVYQQGRLYESALFGYLFEGRSIEKVHDALRAYRNPDGGWGHGMEMDLRTPDSNPAALEYALGFVNNWNLPAGDLFEGASAWVVSQANPDGTLRNPGSLFDYPIAPWWVEMKGQTAPSSIVGNLNKLGLATKELLQLGETYAQNYLKLENIAANEWFFMAYHGYHYYMYTSSEAQFHDAVIENMRVCADTMPDNQLYSVLSFASTPDTPFAKALPELVTRALDYAQAHQQAEGHWLDQHGLSGWYPHVTLLTLYALRSHGRL